jgi:spore coat-associated protein N
MKRVAIIVVIAIITLGVLIGTVKNTWAYYSDIETSSGNTFASGTLELKTNNTDGVTQTLYVTGLKPNNSVGPSTITLQNNGTSVGSTLDIALSYVESDASPNTVNMSADAAAAVIEVTTLTYNGASLLSNITDSNNNGYKDIQDFKNAGLTGLAGLTVSQSKDFVITIKMRDGINNDFQGDGVDITLTFTLRQ